jgi:hypothetical protein
VAGCSAAIAELLVAAIAGCSNAKFVANGWMKEFARRFFAVWNRELAHLDLA